LLENDYEAGLRARLVDGIGHAVEERVKVLAEVRREQKALRDAVQNVLLGLGRDQIRIEEMLVGVVRRLHQILHTIGADRLNDVWTDCLQEHVAFLLGDENL